MRTIRCKRIFSLQRPSRVTNLRCSRPNQLQTHECIHQFDSGCFLGAARRYSDAAAVYSSSDSNFISPDAFNRIFMYDRSQKSTPDEHWDEDKAEAQHTVGASAPAPAPAQVAKLKPIQFRNTLRLFKSQRLTTLDTSDLLVSFFDDGHHEIARRLARNLLIHRDPVFCLKSLGEWFRRMLRVGRLSTVEEILTNWPAFDVGQERFHALLTKTWCSLAWRYALYDELDGAYRVWEVAAQKGFEISPETLTEMGCQYVRASQIYNHYIWVSFLLIFLRRFARADQLDRAEDVLYYLDECVPGGPSESLCFALVLAYERVGRPEDAIKVLDVFAAHNDGNVPRRLQLAVSGAYALSLSEDDHTDRLIRVLMDQQLLPDGKGYDWLNFSKGILGDYDEAFRIIQEVHKSFNSVPKRKQFIALMQAAAEQGDVQYCYQMMAAALEYNIPANTHMMTMAMLAAYKAKQFAVAQDIIAAMRDAADADVRPTAFTYCYALSCLKENERSTTVIEQWISEDELWDEISGEWHILISTQPLLCVAVRCLFLTKITCNRHSCWVRRH